MLVLVSLGFTPISDSLEPGAVGEETASPPVAKPRSFKRAGLSFFVSAMALNVSNFIFHVVVGRLVGPALYGEAMALLNILLVISVVFAGLQAAVTQAAVDAEASGGGFDLRAALAKAGLAGLVLGGLCAAAAPWLSSFLHMASPAPVLVLSMIPALAITSAVLQGLLMARLRYVVVGVALLVGTGIGRLVAGVLLVVAGGGVAAVVAASVIGQVLTLAIMLIAVAPELRNRGEGKWITASDSLASTAALAGYWILASMDVFMVRHLLPARQAGLYAAAATAGRIALFAPGVVVQIVFPRFALRRSSPGHDLALSLEFVAIAGLGAATAIALFPRLLVSVLFGSAFVVPAATVATLAFEGSALALLSLLLYFHIARRSVFALSAWAGVVVAAMGLLLFHGTPEQAALVMLSASVATFALSLFPAIPSLRSAGLERTLTAHLRPSLSAMGPAELDLTLVVPFYNPGPRFEEHLEDIVSVLDSSAVTYEVIAVSDGSTDGSTERIRHLHTKVLRCVELSENMGKGMALRIGLAEGRGAYLGFIDADGDIPATTLTSFLAAIRDRRPDIVSGSKRHKDSDVVYPPLRRLYSWGYQQLLRLLFRLNVRDTQAGLKLIRREVVADVLPLMLEKRFAFDLELLIVAHMLGYRRISEEPVTIRERYASTVSLRTVRQMLQDTLAIYYRLRIVRYYDARSSQAAAGGDTARDVPTEMVKADP